MIHPKELAREKIKFLFKKAEDVFDEDRSLAKRYVQLAKKTARRANARVPKEFKRKFCKHCDSFLKPGKNLRVRTKNGKVIYTCLGCKRFMKFVIPK